MKQKFKNLKKENALLKQRLIDRIEENSSLSVKVYQLKADNFKLREKLKSIFNFCILNRADLD